MNEIEKTMKTEILYEGKILHFGLTLSNYQI